MLSIDVGVEIKNDHAVAELATPLHSFIQLPQLSIVLSVIRYHEKDFPPSLLHCSRSLGCCKLNDTCPVILCFLLHVFNSVLMLYLCKEVSVNIASERLCYQIDLSS